MGKKPDVKAKRKAAMAWARSKTGHAKLEKIDRLRRRKVRAAKSPS